MRKFCPLILATILCSWIGETQADVLFDNLGNTPSGSEGGDNVWMAQKFTTDTNIYNLDSVTMRLASPNASSNMTIAVFSHDPPTFLFPLGKPLAILYTIYSGPAGGKGLTPTFAPIIFSGVNFTLSPSSTFWIVAENDPNSSSVLWQTTIDATGSGVGFTDDFATSTDGGASWGTVGGGQPFLMQLNATVIPEPNSLVLLGIGALIAGTSIPARRSRKL